MASPEIAAMQMALVTITTLMMFRVIAEPVLDRIQSFEKAWGVIR